MKAELMAYRSLFENEGKIFDTHAHYDDRAFDEDRDELLNSFFNRGVGLVVNIGASMQSSEETVRLTKKYDRVFGAVGVHPNEAGDLSEGDMVRLKELLNEPKVLALGEIGLDYYFDTPERELQKYWFEKQLLLAKETDMPICIHSRDAALDTLDIVKKHAEGSRGIIHCFSYEKEMAAEYLKMGFYIGIGGVVTFKNARKLKEVAEYVPLERIVLETDSPYLAPEPLRGTRNNSLNLKYVVSKLAELKGITEEELRKVTFDNALRVYRLK